MLARVLDWVGPVSVSVLSQVGSSVETDERIELVFGMSCLPPILHCVKRKFEYLEPCPKLEFFFASVYRYD